MKLRAQLFLAAFLLSILPLTAIVLYSYDSSRRAVESAYKREVARATRQMDRRLSSIRAELDQRLSQAASLPTANPNDRDPNEEPVVAEIVESMTDIRGLVSSVEFNPDPNPRVNPNPNPRPSRTAADPPSSVAPPAPPAHPALAAAVAPEAPPIPETYNSVIIDLPPPPKFEMSEEQKARLKEIVRLSAELATRSESMSEEERESLEDKLKDLDKDLNREIRQKERDFQRQITAHERAHQQRERQRQMQARIASTISEQMAARSSTSTSSATPSTTATPGTPAEAPRPSARVVSSGPRVRKLSAEEKKRLAEKQKEISLLLGRRFNVPVKKEGAVVGQITAQVSTEEVIRRVLGAPGDDDIAFAVDREGNVYARNAEERERLRQLGVMERLKRNQPLSDIENWIVAMQLDKVSGLRVGVARPVGENLIELRKTAARNFGWGLGLVALALVGIVPFANHITRDVKLVMDGAERISQGDLMTRLPVKSKSEIGQLAVAFNRMAEDLSAQQQRLVTEERTRKEREIQQRLLSVEYERKSVDLEEARRFQLSMLPKEVPRHDSYEVAVFTQTATEVGGDYYDFHVGPSGVLTATMGDATGHGARAGTMVTVIKALFAGYTETTSPAAFLKDAAEKIKRMDLGRMAMALAIARFEGLRLTIASAGMPPVLIHRAARGEVEEITIQATPLGTLGVDYDETEVRLESGDTVLLMSDGFPELLNPATLQLGYVAAADEFMAAAVAPTAQGVIDALATAARRWHGDHPPNDDITFVVVKVA